MFTSIDYDLKKKKCLKIALWQTNWYDGKTIIFDIPFIIYWYSIYHHLSIILPLNKFPLMVKPFPQVASEPWWAPPLRAPAADASRRRTSSDRGGDVGSGVGLWGRRFFGGKISWKCGKKRWKCGKKHAKYGKIIRHVEKIIRKLEMWEKSN